MHSNEEALKFLSNHSEKKVCWWEKRNGNISNPNAIKTFLILTFPSHKNVVFVWPSQSFSLQWEITASCCSQLMQPKVDWFGIWKSYATRYCKKSSAFKSHGRHQPRSEWRCQLKASSLTGCKAPELANVIRHQSRDLKSNQELERVKTKVKDKTKWCRAVKS